MSSYMSIHGVEKIELKSEQPGNDNNRTITITHRNGAEFELTVFGNTDALADLPKSKDFKGYKCPKRRTHCAS